MTVDKRPGRLIGYARVSTLEQNLDMQIEALNRVGCKPIHIEKVSTARPRRPIFQWTLESLREGDTLVVWRLDRLGRDVRQIHATIDEIKAAGASVRSLTEDLNTDTPYGAFALTLTAALAQLERDQVRVRTRAGVDAARRRGVKFGQPPKLNGEQRAQCRKWKKQGLSVRQIKEKVRETYGVKMSHGGIQGYVKPRPPKART